jgi:hypothetical protein
VTQYGVETVVIEVIAHWEYTKFTTLKEIKRITIFKYLNIVAVGLSYNMNENTYSKRDYQRVVAFINKY